MFLHMHFCFCALSGKTKGRQADWCVAAGVTRQRYAFGFHVQWKVGVDLQLCRTLVQSMHSNDCWRIAVKGCQLSRASHQRLHCVCCGELLKSLGWRMHGGIARMISEGGTLTTCVAQVSTSFNLLGLVLSLCIDGRSSIMENFGRRRMEKPCIPFLH